MSRPQLAVLSLIGVVVIAGTIIFGVLRLYSG
jgi:hypothetical protein